MTDTVELDPTRLLGYRPATRGKTGPKIGITKLPLHAPSDPSDARRPDSEAEDEADRGS